MEKKYKTGLVLGKFMPLHKGHMYLIGNAISQCEIVHVMVCTQLYEEIDGNLRYNWMKSIYNAATHPSVVVHHCTDANPQYPSECESKAEFYAHWKESVESRIPDLSVVFTSEDYGDEFASYLGCMHVSVDPKREVYPISGTMCRNDVFKNWDMIPDTVCRFYTKRVAIVGPESVGKSTITEALSKELDCWFVPEYGREYAKKVQGVRGWHVFDFDKIAMQQNELIEYAAGKGTKCVITDTEAITTSIFMHMYLPNSIENKTLSKHYQLQDKLINTQNIDLYILLAPTVPWADDGTREFPKGRGAHFKKIKSYLRKYGKNYIVIKDKNWDVRYAKARDEIKKLIT